MLLSERVREEICRKVSAAPSEQDVPHVLCQAILSANLNWRDVPLDEYKQVLVGSIRDFRNRSSTIPLIRCDTPTDVAAPHTMGHTVK